MKRFFAAGGLVLASLVYFFTQHSNGEGQEQRQVIPPDGIASSSSSTTSGATPFGPAVKSTAAVSSDDTAGTHSAADGGSSSAGSSATQGTFKNGTYTGSAADAYYGYVQVAAVVSGGQLTDVKVLQYPNDRSTSRYINSQALPYLVQEAVQAQSSKVNTISGASDTSMAFRESLSSALSQAS